MPRYLLLLSAALIATPAAAQVRNTEPQPIPIIDRTPSAREIPYPGMLTLNVDATDVARHIYRVRQTIPVAGPGPMTLLYPEWLPGNHAPRGPIQTIAGLRISGNGQPIQWRRDNADVFAFHLDVPAGVSTIEVEFQHLSPSQTNQGRVTMTPDMLNLQWEKLSLYPAGYYVGVLDLTYTIGATVGKGGVLSGVAWDSRLFNAGVPAGATLVAVNGREYSDDALKSAITGAKTTRRPIQLLVKDDQLYKNVALNHFEGLRYPALEKIGAGPSTLDALLRPLK